MSFSKCNAEAAKLSALGTFKHLGAGSTVADLILNMQTPLGEKKLPLHYMLENK